jgi:hypothetical protein
MGELVCRSPPLGAGSHGMDLSAGLTAAKAIDRLHRADPECGTLLFLVSRRGHWEAGFDIAC